MTTLTEGRHAGEFLVSEASGTRSRATGTVASGQNLVAGQVVMLSGGNLVAMSGSLDSDGDLVNAPEGVIWGNVDATDGAIAGVPYIARDAEVNGDELTYPDVTSDGDEVAKVNAGLAALGIIVR